MHVSLSTLRQALQLVDGLAEIDDPADFGERVLPGLAGLIGCDLVSYNEIGAGPAPGRTYSCGYPAEVITPARLGVFEAHVHQHPLVNHYRATDDGRPVKISDFLDQEHLHRLALYAEFFRTFSIEHQLAVALPSPAATVIGFAFNRARGDFTEAERDVLGVLRAPLMTARARAAGRHRATRSDYGQRQPSGPPDRPRAADPRPRRPGPHQWLHRQDPRCQRPDYRQAPRAHLSQTRCYQPRRRCPPCHPTMSAARHPGPACGLTLGRGLPGHLQARAAGPRLVIWSAMIDRWTSLVPSQMRSTRSSRKKRSATFSRM
jgi:hypothetical protein